MTRVVSALVVLLTVCSLTAQRPIAPPPERPIPQQSSTGKPTQYAITVKGCINKKVLTLSSSEAAALSFEMLRASEFTLTGSQELLQQIREHNGHHDEIAGVVTVPAPRRGVVSSVDAKKLGPTSLGVGSRESIRVDEAPRFLTLKVESVTHLTERCAERR